MTAGAGRPRFVRQFAITNGRARVSGAELDLDSIVVSVLPASDGQRVGIEHGRALLLCVQPMSIAEISAHLDVYLGVARVLVGDLRDGGFVQVSGGVVADDGPDLDTLERLLHDLQTF